MPDLASSPGLVGELAKAADKGSWALFVKLLGGPQQARRALPVGIEMYEDSRHGRYGETIGPRVAGIRHGNVVFSTRFHTWTIKPKAHDHNCTQINAPAAKGSQVRATVIGFPPWSSVNNCTPG